MKRLKLEEMLVNAILNPEKKYRHYTWKPHEYIYWNNNGRCAWLCDEINFPIEWTEIDMLLTGWMEFKNDS